ncbi:hypothetical protein [Cupriavidus oxalaticus]|uniref:hypothetical protein n=1 Tax=Cupriavidus oxalaticus TaxID=96344 RepID=UPI0031717292
MTVVVLAMDGSPDSVAAARRLASRPLLAAPLSTVPVIVVNPRAARARAPAQA